MGETREPQPPLSTAARATVTVTFLHFSAGTHLISLPCLLLQAASEDHKDNLKPSNSKDRKTLLCISPEGYRKDLGIKKNPTTSPLDYWYKSNNVSAFFLFFFFKKTSLFCQCVLEMLNVPTWFCQTWKIPMWCRLCLRLHPIQKFLAEERRIP